MKNLLLVFYLAFMSSLIGQNLDKKSMGLYHQFDFWLGEWDVYKFGTDTIVGYSKIESIIDSVGLLENYSAKNSTYQGKSINKYNPTKKRWEQYWVDNSGLTLFLFGGISEQKMVLTDLAEGDSSATVNKIIWQKMENLTVRQTWHVSTDAGKTWSVVFDGAYKRKKEK